MDGSTTVQIQVLLDRFHGGDAAAKAELVRISEDRLLQLTHWMLHDYPRGREHDDTKGIFNESYLRFHTALDEAKPATARQFLGLAALAIRRTLLDLVRKYRGRGEKPWYPPGNLDGIEGGQFVEPDRFALSEDIFSAIDELPDDLREVVMLHHFQGLLHAEIAGLLGLHEDSVKRRWAKARLSLSRKLVAYRTDDGESWPRKSLRWIGSNFCLNGLSNLKLPRRPERRSHPK